MISCWLSHALAIFWNVWRLKRNGFLSIDSLPALLEWQRQSTKHLLCLLKHRKVIKYLCISKEEKATKEKNQRNNTQCTKNCQDKGTGNEYCNSHKSQWLIIGLQDEWMPHATLPNSFEIGTFILCKVYYCQCIGLSLSLAHSSTKKLHFDNDHHHLYCFTVQVMQRNSRNTHFPPNTW